MHSRVSKWTWGPVEFPVLPESANTAKAYRQALQAFAQALAEHDLDVSAPAESLPEDAVAWFADTLKAYAPATGAPIPLGGDRLLRVHVS